MRLRQAVAGLRDAEIPIVRVSAQAIGFEILVAIVADGDALLRTNALGGWQRVRLGLAIFCLDRFPRREFGGGFARRRFLLRGGAGSGPRGRLLLCPRRSPFPSMREREHKSQSAGGKRK